MLCGDPTRQTWNEGVLCDTCEVEFRKLFGRKRLRVPLKTVDEVRDIIAFAAGRIFANMETLEELIASRHARNS